MKGRLPKLFNSYKNGNSTDRIKRGWNQYASGYGEFHEPAVFRNSSLQFDKYFSALKKPKAVDLLEISCGTGLLAEHILRTASPLGRVVFTDLSDKMIALTRKRLEKLHSPHKFELIEQNAETLDQLDTHSFDFIVSHLSLNLMEFPESAVGSIKNVMRNNGHFLCGVLGPLDKCSYFKIFEDALTDNNVFTMNETRSKHHMGDPKNFRNIIEHQGFKVDDFNAHTIEIEAKHLSVKHYLDQPLSQSILRRESQGVQEKITASLVEKIDKMKVDKKHYEIQIHNYLLSRA